MTGGTEAGAPATDVIVPPGAMSAQGIAKGARATPSPAATCGAATSSGETSGAEPPSCSSTPRPAMGLWADPRHGWLSVGGGLGWAYVYDIETGAAVATYQLGKTGVWPRRW
ncbi:hypothetical protein [Streptosporangium nondiastaticum]|uniref:hypothetical protein n=1 Tax=Streptosporangium nondiastaticum TaxID=35764 RepID=UPI001CB97C28|nr:hypothetical protein [Streptosporangium nondiastaticum]